MTPSSNLPPPQGALINSAWRQIAQAQLPQPGATVGLCGPGVRRQIPGPDAIPGYRILGEIHRGGQGVVYRAVQESTQRTVALKVMLGGAFASESARARFAREVQILAELRHPNIVTIHDSGSAGDSQFFIMDYVEGRPLDRFLSETAPPLRKRLQLFCRICTAVNAAHLRGIIHRDLKPSNILVAESGAVSDRESGPTSRLSRSKTAPTGEPRILDFGLARHADEDGSAAPNALTVTGQFIGSLPWASPEQARGRHDQIDLRTDVYALGVVLYQILTGDLPYDVSGGIDSALHNIVHSDPADPRTHNRTIDDDLVTIVLKALRKEREQRYETAGSLGRDVERYLAGEPIEAKRDNSWYVLRRMIRRNRGVVLAGGVIAATLVVATVISLRFGIQATQERERAEKNAEVTRQVAEFQSALLSGIEVDEMGRGIIDLLREQVRASLESRQSGERPDRSERTPDDIAAQLAAYDEMAGAVQPADVARGVLDAHVLGDVAATVESKFADQPGVQASLLFTLGATYHSLGLFEQAEPVFRRALELRKREDPSGGLLEAETISHLAGALSEMGRSREAEELHLEALGIFRRGGVADNPSAVRAMNNVGTLRANLGDYAASEAMLREALTLARALPVEEREILADCLANLGGALAHQGKYEEAEPLIREALALRRDIFGDDHPLIAHTLANLGSVRAKRGDVHEAESLFRDAVERYRASVGNEHPDLTFPMVNLAHALQAQGKVAEAKAQYLETLALCRKTLGGDHPTTAVILHGLGSLHLSSGEDSAAEPLLREAIALFRVQLGEHPKVANSLNSLALALRRGGNPAAAEPLNREAVQILDKQLPATHELRLGAHIGLARTLVKLEQLDEAQSVLSDVEYHWASAEVLPHRVRVAFHEAFVELYDAKHAADPTSGYDRHAAEWRAKLAEWQATTKPTTP